MDYSYGATHAYAKCEDCGKEFTCHKNAQALSKIHAEKYGHNVSGELGIAFSYYGKG